MKIYSISRRLVEDVMKIAPMNSEDFNLVEGSILYKDGKRKSISYNDFFFSCIKWAWDKKPKIVLSSSYRNCSVYKQEGGVKFNLIKSFDSIDQKEALFDACEWILDNFN